MNYEKSNNAGSHGKYRLLRGKNSFVSSRFWRFLPAGMRKRWWLFRIPDLIVKFCPVLKKRSGMLIVRMDGIGDMVLFRRSLDLYTGVFGFAKDKITVVGCKSWEEIGKDIFAGYMIKFIDEHAFAKQPFYRFRTGLMVKFLAPKITICDQYFRRAMMADSLVWMASAPKSISSLPFINESTRAEFKYYLSQVDEVVDTGPYPTHEVCRHYDFLSHFSNHRLTPKTPRIKWRNRKPALAELKNLEKPYVIINPGSNEYGRRWPVKNYLVLAQHINSAGLCVLFIGGPNEKIAGLDIDLKQEGIIDLRSKTELPDLLDIIKHAKCMISNDTGPAHLSIALGTPTVVIVGGGHFRSFVPYPEEIRPPNVRFAFEEASCYHCFWNCDKRENNKQGFPCISAITVEQIWRHTRDLVRKK